MTANDNRVQEWSNKDDPCEELLFAHSFRTRSVEPGQTCSVNSAGKGMKLSNEKKKKFTCAHLIFCSYRSNKIFELNWLGCIISVVKDPLSTVINYYQVAELITCRVHLGVMQWSLGFKNHTCSSHFSDYKLVRDFKLLKA